MTLTGEAIAAIITAFLMGLGSLIAAFVNARNSSKKSDMEGMQAVVTTMRTEMTNQAKQISELQRENNTLHETDNNLKAENLQQRKELEAVREENRRLREQVDKQAAEIITLREENATLRNELDAYKQGKKRQTGGLGEAGK